jgi:hypothetical protein
LLAATARLRRERRLGRSGAERSLTIAEHR